MNNARELHSKINVIAEAVSAGFGSTVVLTMLADLQGSILLPLDHEGLVAIARTLDFGPNQRIQHIKTLREYVSDTYGATVGLKEAKDAVDVVNPPPNIY